VFRYPIASRRYTNPMANAGIRNGGKMTLPTPSVINGHKHTGTSSRDNESGGKEGGEGAVDHLER
jgi:hypothetical protein